MNDFDTTCTMKAFETLFSFVEEMNPDFEMCCDYCEAQGIEVIPDVVQVIEDLLINREGDSWYTDPNSKASYHHY
jgi:hypothetical protein